jgi:hypothetical protein
MARHVWAPLESAKHQKGIGSGVAKAPLVKNSLKPFKHSNSHGGAIPSAIWAWGFNLAPGTQNTTVAEIVE